MNDEAPKLAEVAAEVPEAGDGGESAKPDAATGAGAPEREGEGGSSPSPSPSTGARTGDSGRKGPSASDEGDETESLFEAPAPEEQVRMVEAMLFASAAPLTFREMTARMPHGSDPESAVATLRELYAGRGVRVVEVDGSWAIRTAPDLGYLMRNEVVETRKLSRAAVETLAIVAYHQPVTRAEIEEIRGVSVSRGTIDQLLELEWIRLGRRKMTPGRPVTFVVTESFLDHFGLANPGDLPGLKELRETGLLESRPPLDRGAEGSAYDGGLDDGEEADELAGQSALFDDSDGDESGPETPEGADAFAETAVGDRDDSPISALGDAEAVEDAGTGRDLAHAGESGGAGPTEDVDNPAPSEKIGDAAASENAGPPEKPYAV